MARKEITAYTLERGDVRKGEEDRDYMKMSIAHHLIKNKELCVVL